MPNYVSVYEHQTWPNPALAVVRGRAAMLLRYDVPTYYVFREILAAALRTELPDGMVLRLFRFHLTPWSCYRREPYVIRLRANARFLFSHELQAYSPCQTGFSTSQAANFISPLLHLLFLGRRSCETLLPFSCKWQQNIATTFPRRRPRPIGRTRRTAIIVIIKPSELAKATWNGTDLVPQIGLRRRR
jgi:hypothetical protein